MIIPAPWHPAASTPLRTWPTRCWRYLSVMLVALLAVVSFHAWATDPPNAARARAEQQAIYVESWLQKMRANSQQGLILGLLAINKYQDGRVFSNDHANPADIQKLLSLSKRQNDALNDIVDDLSKYKFGGTTRKSIERAISVFSAAADPESKVYLEVFKQLAAAGFEGADNIIGPDAETAAQAQVRRIANFFNSEARNIILESLEKTRDGYFYEGFNNFFQPFVGADSRSSIDQILLANPELASQIRDEKNQKLLELILSKADSNDKTNASLLNAGLVIANKQLLESAKIAELLKHRDESDQQREARLEQAKEAALALERDRADLAVTLGLANAILRVLDPKGAAAFSSAVQLGNKIAANFASFDAKKLTGYALAGSNVLAIAGFISDLQASDEGAMAAISDQLTQIQKQIAALHADLVQRLDYLDSRLSDVLRGIDGLMAELALQTRGSNEIREALLNITLQLQGSERRLLASIASVPEIEVRNKIKTCVRRPAQAKFGITAQIFLTDCLDRFWTWGVDVPKLPLYTAVALDLDNFSELVKLISSVDSTERLPIFAALSRAMESGVASTGLNADLGNPLVWMNGATAYAQTVTVWPDLVKETGLKTTAIDELRQQGRQYRDAWVRISDSANLQKVLSSLLETYRVAALDLLTSIKQAESDWRAAQGIDPDLKSLDLGAATAEASLSFQLSGNVHGFYAPGDQLPTDAAGNKLYGERTTQVLVAFPGINQTQAWVPWTVPLHIPASYGRFLDPAYLLVHKLGKAQIRYRLFEVSTCLNGPGECMTSAYHSNPRLWYGISNAGAIYNANYDLLGYFDVNSYQFQAALPPMRVADPASITLTFHPTLNALDDRLKTLVPRMSGDVVCQVDPSAVAGLGPIGIDASLALGNGPIVNGSFDAKWYQSRVSALSALALKIIQSLTNDWEAVAKACDGRSTDTYAIRAAQDRKNPKWFEQYVNDWNAHILPVRQFTEAMLDGQSKAAAAFVLQEIDASAAATGKLQRARQRMDDIKFVMDSYLAFAMGEALVSDSLAQTFLFGNAQLLSSADILSEFQTNVRSQAILTRTSLSRPYGRIEKLVSESVANTRDYLGLSGPMKLGEGRVPEFIDATLSRLDLARGVIVDAVAQPQ